MNEPMSSDVDQVAYPLDIFLGNWLRVTSITPAKIRRLPKIWNILRLSFRKRMDVTEV